jgi:hypothetical protein
MNDTHAFVITDINKNFHISTKLAIVGEAGQEM